MVTSLLKISFLTACLLGPSVSFQPEKMRTATTLSDWWSYLCINLKLEGKNIKRKKDKKSLKCCFRPCSHLDLDPTSKTILNQGLGQVSCFTLTRLSSLKNKEVGMLSGPSNENFPEDIIIYQTAGGSLMEESAMIMINLC